MNALDQFREAMTSAGLEAPDVLLDVGGHSPFQPPRTASASRP